MITKGFYDLSILHNKAIISVMENLDHTFHSMILLSRLIVAAKYFQQSHSLCIASISILRESCQPKRALFSKSKNQFCSLKWAQR